VRTTLEIDRDVLQVANELIDALRGRDAD